MQLSTFLSCSLALAACATPAVEEGAKPDPGHAEASAPTPSFAAPLSANLAARNVLGIIEDQRDDGAIELQALSADYRPRRGRNPEEVVVKLDLSFFGSNSLEAVNAYTTLAQAIANEPWCIELEDVPTSVMNDGHGIYVRGLVVHIVPSGVEPRPDFSGPPWAAEPDRSDLLLLVTHSAVHDKVLIGQVDTNPSTTNPEFGVEDLHLKVEPSTREAWFPLASVLNFGSVLEWSSGGDVIMTGLKLQPAAKTAPHERVQDRWNFEGEVTLRRAID